MDRKKWTRAGGRQVTPKGSPVHRSRFGMKIGVAIAVHNLNTSSPASSQPQHHPSSFWLKPFWLKPSGSNAVFDFALPWCVARLSADSRTSVGGHSARIRIRKKDDGQIGSPWKFLGHEKTRESHRLGCRESGESSAWSIGSTFLKRPSTCTRTCCRFYRACSSDQVHINLTCCRLCSASLEDRIRDARTCCQLCSTSSCDRVCGAGSSIGRLLRSTSSCYRVCGVGACRHRHGSSSSERIRGSGTCRFLGSTSPYDRVRGVRARRHRRGACRSEWICCSSTCRLVCSIFNREKQPGQPRVVVQQEELGVAEETVPGDQPARVEQEPPQQHATILEHIAIPTQTSSSSHKDPMQVNTTPRRARMPEDDGDTRTVRPCLEMSTLISELCERDVPEIDWEKLYEDNSSVFDTYIGLRLDEAQVKAGRETEVKRMLGFEVYEEVSAELARGKRIRNITWLDSHKKPGLVRSRLVVNQVRGACKREDVFAATPPLAAMRFILSRAASRGQWILVPTRSQTRGLVGRGFLAERCETCCNTIHTWHRKGTGQYPVRVEQSSCLAQVCCNTLH